MKKAARMYNCKIMNIFEQKTIKTCNYKIVKFLKEFEFEDHLQ